VNSGREPATPAKEPAGGPPPREGRERAPTVSHLLSLEARLRSLHPFPHELAALFYVVAGGLILELLPVTYPRKAVVMAAWWPAKWIAATGIAAVAARRGAAWWRDRHRPPAERPRSTVGIDLLVLLRAAVILVPVLSVHFLLKSFIHLVNPRTWDVALWKVDQAACFGLSPSLLLTGLFASPWFLQLLDLVYSRLYFFLIVLSVPLLLVLPTLPRRMAFLSAYTSVWITGSVVYLALPSWGPVFIVSQVFEEALRHMPATVGVQSVLFEELSSLVRDPLGPRLVQFGCVAAFPSLHLAVVTVFAAASRWTSRRWFVGNALIVLVMLIGSVVTGYHYLVDGWAGMLLGIAACWLGRRLFPDTAEERSGT